MSFLKIKIVGLGGAGVNTIFRLSREKIPGVELIAVNTDSQSLVKSFVSKKILIGKNTASGFGTGMDVKLGERAVKESYKELEQAILPADIVFLTAGFGGGTGTAAVPIIGEMAKKTGALTIAVITLPFSFEGMQRKKIANLGIQKLKDKVDGYVCIQNDRLSTVLKDKKTLESAFENCDDILKEAIKGISDLISYPGIINADIADVYQILKGSGKILLGVGRAKGEKSVQTATLRAANSPLLEPHTKDYKGILLNIFGKEDLTLEQLNSAADFIKRAATPNTKIVFGVSEDKSLDDKEVKVIFIATLQK